MPQQFTNPNTVSGQFPAQFTGQNPNLRPRPMQVNLRPLPTRGQTTVASQATAQTTQTTNPLAQFSPEEIEMAQFVDTLVGAITGYSIAELKPEKREEITQSCLDTFIQYVIKFVETKYGKADAIRLKAAQQFPNSNIFAKFAELGAKFDEAYLSFVSVLEQNAQAV